jgi:uncharacterized protein (TIGR03435 family)
MSGIYEVVVALSDSLAASILAKVTVTTALALMAVRLTRRSRAAVRHVVLAAAFGVLLVLPVAAIVAPAIRVEVPIAARGEIAPPMVEPARDAGSPAAPAVARADERRAAPQSEDVALSTLMFAAWTIGTTVFLLPMGLGLWQVRSLRTSALPWRHGRSVVDAQSRHVGIRRRVEVLLHESVPGPMTCGMFRPVIVLPIDAGTWAEEDLRRAIVHELEHVRRGDWGSQCVARTLCAFYWFHPLVWAAWRQLALEAERACDDAVLRRAGTVDAATAYADQLVELAQRLSAAPGQPQLAMANRHDLAARVAAVLDTHQRRGRAGAPWIALASATAAVMVMTMSPLRLVAGQSQADKPAAIQRFDAASVRPCRTEDDPAAGRGRGTAGGTNASFSLGRMHVPCVTVQQLIYLAYAGSGARPEERLMNDAPGRASNAVKVRGGPAWVHSDRDGYTVEATAEGASERSVLLGAMLRTLLEERFRLKIHRESEEAPMYTLSVAKGGFKLKPMKEGDCNPDRTAPIGVPGVKLPCGLMTSQGRGPNAVWTFTSGTMMGLTIRLASTLGQHVIDKTGITGEFLINLEFHPDENTPGIKWPAERSADQSVPHAASIFTALEEQLGLKLEKTKGQRGFLVIDHIERPER